jgi:hypothetical protein
MFCFNLHFRRYCFFNAAVFIVQNNNCHTFVPTFFVPLETVFTKKCSPKLTHFAVTNCALKGTVRKPGDGYRDSWIERGLSKFSIPRIEGARIGAMSLVVIKSIWFWLGYIARLSQWGGRRLRHFDT